MTRLMPVALAGLVLTAACRDGTAPAVAPQFRFEGASMEPAYPNGTVVDVLDYGTGEPQRGDVIVFDAPTRADRQFAKRIIGLPGDSVEIVPESDRVLVNGEAIVEPYVRGPTQCLPGCGPWAVPSGYYFVLGDNRQNSSDSRQGWLVPRENIVGRIEARDEENQYSATVTDHT